MKLHFLIVDLTRYLINARYISKSYKKEIFQWKPKNIDIENVKDEIADVIIYCLLLCEHYDLDIKEVIFEKIEKNDKKYQYKNHTVNQINIINYNYIGANF